MRPLNFCPLLLAAFALSAAEFPAPSVDIPTPASKQTATAVLAGGCFWGVEAVFNRLRGVSNVVSGFAGGNKGTAHYDIVSTGTTGHAESVKITHDPSEISYGKLLEVFFSVAYDPTELNRQGPGHRHGVSIRDFLRLGRADTRSRSPIVTEVTPLNGFYAAEDHHQHFLDHNPTNPYIVYNDVPKLERLKQQFPELLKHR